MKLFFWKKSIESKPEVVETLHTETELERAPTEEKPTHRAGTYGAVSDKPTHVPTQSRAEEIKVNRRPAFDPRREPIRTPQEKPFTSMSTPKVKPQEALIQEVAGPEEHKVLPIKRWCEKELTPVAWARVLVRILPVLRQYGYNFSDIQNPGPSTQIRNDFYFVILATIQEIYELSYEEQAA